MIKGMIYETFIINNVINITNTIHNTIHTVLTIHNTIHTVRAASNAINTLLAERNTVGAQYNAINTLPGERSIINVLNIKKYNIVHTIKEVANAVTLTTSSIRSVILSTILIFFSTNINIVDKITDLRVKNADSIAIKIINYYGPIRIHKDLMKEGIISIEVCLYNALKCIKIFREIYMSLNNINS